MADITMCTSLNWPKREECYRTKANQSPLQSWSDFEYTCNEDSGFCDFIAYVKNTRDFSHGMNLHTK